MAFFPISMGWREGGGSEGGRTLTSAALVAIPFCSPPLPATSSISNMKPARVLLALLVALPCLWAATGEQWTEEWVARA